MKIGTLDGVLAGKNKTPWEGLYPMARRLGFEGLELGVGGDYDKTQLWSKEGRAKLLQCSRETGVATCSICLHSYWTYSFANPDAAVRSRAAAIAREAAAAAAALGAANILIPLTDAKGVDDATCRDRWIEGMRSCASAAESEGVVFCLENVSRHYANEHKDVLAIVAGIDSPAVQIYFDPANSLYAGLDPLPAIPLFAGRIRQLHVKDVRDGKAAHLGEGLVPWPKVLAGLAAIRYDGWLVLETESDGDPEGSARKNLATLKKLIG